MKKTIVTLFFLAAGLSGLCLTFSCSTSTPTSPGGFQAPVETLVAINPSFTPTATFTPTITPTITPTGTPTATFTPYVASTPWGGFNQPSAVAVDGNGDVYVADQGANQVEKFNDSGSLVVSWGAGGKGKGKISYPAPMGVAVDSNGNLYVCGNTPESVERYDASGNAVTQFTGANSIAFSGLKGVAVDAAGDLFISDSGNLRIVELSSSGSYMTSIPTGQTVYGITVDGNNQVYGALANSVVDFSSPVTIPGFKNPYGLSADASNNLYVADAGNHQVEEFGAGQLHNTPLAIFNDGGALNGPRGIAVNRGPGTAYIYVADPDAGKLFQFTP
jgi:streptogramin lyase